MKYKLPSEYYDYLNIFNRTKTDILLLYRSYNYKLKFNNSFDKTKFSKSRIYLILEYKLKQIKKYLNKYLKKRFIILSYILFILSILFIKKSNRELRFYIDYRKLNAIIKRNRYLIPLIDEVLIRIQEYKYLTRLDIIAAFNKLRIYPDSEDFTTFIISLKVYKYRILPFDLINGSAIY